MTINVRLHPGASQNKINKLDDANFAVYVTAQPHDNEANAATIKLLADYFHVAPSLITIQKGQKSRQKTITIDN